MNVLFVHNNFPAQFANLARDLAADERYVVKAIGTFSAPGVSGIEIQRYRQPFRYEYQAHPFARHFNAECQRAEQVLFAATALASRGYIPDVVIAHCGWGENLPLRAVFPNAKIVIYCEFYFRAQGQDINFDPEGPTRGADSIVTMQCRNASTLIALADADLGISPTLWQRSTYPSEFQHKIVVSHEGVDVESASPNEHAFLLLPTGRKLVKKDEIVTFVSRNLEQTRGYHIFMRALPKIMLQRPNAQILIIGGDEHSYGPSAPSGETWKDIYLRENAPNLDLSRVSFLGVVDRSTYISALQISTVHVYLTYPFVLSWSLVEAMSVGCRIVASDTSPVQEVIDDESGILTPFFDPSALSERIIEVITSPNQYIEMSLRARQVAIARFSSKSCTTALRKLIGIE